MAVAPEPHRLSDIEWERIEASIQAFEAAWLRGECPSIDDAMAAVTTHPQLLLVELVHADLEFRLKAGESARVETYLAAHPDLLQRTEVIVGLLRAEWTLRARHEPDLTVDHYLTRFPQLTTELVSSPVTRRPLVQAPKLKATGLLPDEPLPRWLGKYELRQVVGSGAFGFVYRAWDSVLNRDVAIKVPRPEMAASPVDLSNFLREARNAINLRHPNIVEIWDAGPIDQTVCLVSEFVEGITLTERLRIGSIGVGESVKLMRDVLGALDHAHRHQIIHRDLKPSNILLDRAEVPHLTDFGLAKRVSGDSTLSPAGAAQVLIGTPAYMAPEQARGDTGSVDIRSDIYSAGVLLFELLTGSVPFRGRGRLLQIQIEEAAPPSPRALNDEVRPELETICLKALAKHPADRYQSAAAMAEDLANFSAGRPISVRPEGDPSPPRGRPRGWTRRLAVGIVGVTMLASLGVPWLGMLRRGRLDRQLINQYEHAFAATIAAPFHGGGDAAAEHRSMTDAFFIHATGWLDTLADRPGLTDYEFDLLIRAADHAAAVGSDPATRVAWERAVAALDRKSRDRPLDEERQIELARGLALLGRLDSDAGAEARAQDRLARALFVWRAVVGSRRDRLADAPNRSRALIGLAEALLAEDGVARREGLRPTPGGVEEAERTVKQLRSTSQLATPDLLRLLGLELDLARRCQALGLSLQAASWGRFALRTGSLVSGGEPDPGLGVAMARAKVLATQADVADPIAGVAPGGASDDEPILLLRSAAADLARAMSRDPLDLELPRERAAAEVKIGKILAHRGRLVEATQAFRRALGLIEAVRSARPLVHADLAASAQIHAHLGQLDEEAGRASAAIGQMAIAIVQIWEATQLARGVPAYHKSRSDFVAAFRRLLSCEFLAACDRI